MSARVCLFVCLAFVWAMFVFPQISRAWAADDAPAAAAAGGGQGDAAKPEETKSESGILWFLRCSGLIGFFILLLSIYFVALVIRMFMTLKVDMALPADVSATFQQLVTESNMEGAYEVVHNSESFLGKVVSRGIEHLVNGLPEARHAMERTADAETVRMEKEISMMAVLGTLGPMIGLIGTLKGMIASFSVIAISGTSLKASEVAQGISEALLLTFEGVFLSVPAIYFYAFFRNRISVINSDGMLEADDMLHRFFRAGRAKAAPAPPQPAVRRQ